MKRWNSVLSRSVATTVVTSLLCLLPASNERAQIVVGGISVGGSSSSSSTASTSTSDTTSYRGEAAVVAGAALGVGLSVSDTGPLPSSGGAQETSLLSEEAQMMLSVEAAHASTIGQAGMTASEASVGNVGFTTCNTMLIGGNTVTADFVMSHAMASCCTNGASLSGSSEIAGLVINGQAITVSGQPNQCIYLAGGSMIVINEQITSQTADSADITVNALHIKLCEGADVVVSSAFAGVTCGTSSSSSGGGTAPPSSCNDFLTGGGWITGTPSGAKANFGVGGGFKNGAFWGHLNYIDHGSGMHVKATAVTGYAVDPNDADCRIIDYDVTIDGQAGTARVRACDKGEPGRNDIFQIQLSNGYFAGGDLGGSRPGGGNIQLHKCQ